MYILECDRKQQREERKAKLRGKKDDIMPPVPGSPIKSPSTPPTPGCGRLGNPFKMTLPAMAPTPDIDEPEDEIEKETEEVPSKGTVKLNGVEHSDGKKTWRSDSIVHVHNSIISNRVLNCVLELDSFNSTENYLS